MQKKILLSIVLGILLPHLSNAMKIPPPPDEEVSRKTKEIGKSTKKPPAFSIKNQLNMLDPNWEHPSSFAKRRPKAPLPPIEKAPLQELASFLEINDLTKKNYHLEIDSLMQDIVTHYNQKEFWENNPTHVAVINKYHSFLSKQPLKGSEFNADHLKCFIFFISSSNFDNKNFYNYLQYLENVENNMATCTHVRLSEEDNSLFKAAKDLLSSNAEMRKRGSNRKKLFSDIPDHPLTYAFEEEDLNHPEDPDPEDPEYHLLRNAQDRKKC